MQHLRIAHAQTAMECYGWQYDIRHAQFVRCQTAVVGDDATVRLRNALVCDTSTAFDLYGTDLYGEQVTLNTVTTLRYLVNSSSLSLTNSLLVQVTNIGSFNAVSVRTNSSAADVFVEVGAGKHYLKSDSPYLNLGNTNIEGKLVAELKTMTVFAPIVWANDFFTDYTLSARLIRDNGTQPALGYHYPYLDYCWTVFKLTNATLPLTNGVAIGVYGSQGLTLQSGAKLSCEGAPLQMNRLTAYHTVQEQPLIWGNAAFSTLLRVTNMVLPEVSMRFTDVSIGLGVYSAQALFDSGYNLVSTWAWNDCQVRGGAVTLATPLYPVAGVVQTVGLTNNVFERVVHYYGQGFNGNPTAQAVHLRNNLFRNSVLSLHTYTNTTIWTVHDNLFDTVSLSAYNGYGSLTHSHNAYKSTTSLGSATGNKTLGQPST